MDDVLEREREVHDALAEELDPEAMPPRAPVDLEPALLGRLGDVAGKDVLDLGCGQGDLSLLLAQADARVTALDLSGGMIQVLQRRAERFLAGRRIETLVSEAEVVDRPDGSFDLIVGKWILHHCDLERLAPEVHRLLRPGGRAVFIENSGLNPMLTFAREHVAGRFGVARMGTPDERPLLERDYEVLSHSFGRVERLYPRFDMFTLFDRQVFRYRSRLVSRLCGAGDRFVERRLPRLRRYSFRVVVELWR